MSRGLTSTETGDYVCSMPRRALPAKITSCGDGDGMAWVKVEPVDPGPENTLSNSTCNKMTRQKGQEEGHFPPFS